MSDAAEIIINNLFDHNEYLDAISDLITYTYQKHEKYGCIDIYPHMTIDENYFNGFDKNNNYEAAIRNLRNAWYHEVSFIQDNTSPKLKMKFTAWKIIQFYYGIFCALSAIVRCNTNKNIRRHDEMINYFTNDILIRKELKNFFPQPFCFIMTQNGNIKPEFRDKINWKHGLKVKCPSIKKCLSMIFKNKTVSLFHYFLTLRTWVNYESAYIFRRYYSKSVKPKMYNNMLQILTTFISIAEIYLINVIGYKIINDEAWLFISEFLQYMEENTYYKNSVTSSIRNRLYYYNEQKWGFT